jgi:predicted dehydrogenase
VVGLGVIVSMPAASRLDDWRRLILPYGHAHAIAISPVVDLVAVCDLDQACIDGFLTEWGSTFPTVATYRDFDDMLGAAAIDILIVCTPEDKHTSFVEKAAAAGVPAILCEKPIATTLEDADRIIDATARAGCVLSVNYTRRWDPFYYRAWEMVRAGMLGTVGTIVATCAGSQAMMFRNGTHMVDLMNFYAGAEPAQVFGLLEPGFEDFVAYRGEGRHKDADSDPGSSGLVLYANGVRGFYNGTKDTFAATSPRLGQELDISGTEGRIRISDGIAEFWSHEQGTGSPVRRTFPAVFTARGTTESSIEDVARVLRDGGQTRCTGREARRALAVMLGIVESSRQGGRLIPVSAR